MIEPETWIETMLLLAAVLFILSCGLAVYATIIFLKARRFLETLRRGPQVLRETNGKRQRERI